jgi:hypothetical protein
VQGSSWPGTGRLATARPSRDGRTARESARFDGVSEPSSKNRRVDNSAFLRLLGLLVAAVVLIVFTAVGVVGQELSFGRALRDAIPPFAVALTLAIFTPRIRDRLSNGG